MKRPLLLMLLLVLLIPIPLFAPSTIPSYDMVQKAIPAESPSYYESFADVSDWTVSGSGSITTDGNEANMTTEGWVGYVEYYTEFEAFDMYSFTYSFNVTDSDNAEGTLKSYDGSDYYVLCTIDGTGAYEGIVEAVGAMERLSFYLVSSDLVTDGWITVDYLSIEYNTQSITGFNQTISGDTLYYPDSFGTETLLADASEATGTFDYEYNDHEATWALDATTWELDALVDATGFVMYQYLNFSLGGLYLESFSFNIYSCYEPSGNTIIASSICYYDGASWVNVSAVPDPYAWVNSSIIAGDMITDSIMLRIYLTGVVTSAYVGLFIDYAEAVAYLKTDNYGYMESFSDVSDIIEPVGVNNPNSEVVTDGDVATFTAEFLVGNDVEAWNLSVDLDGMEYYFEICWYVNSTSTDFIGLYFYDDSANYYFYQDSSEPVTWESVKGRVSSLSKVGSPSDLNYVYVYIRGDSGAVDLYADYFRIAKADEFGYSHDGSTTEGVTVGVGTASSDGDKITFSSSGGTGYFDFYIDTTATAAKLQPSYYPMLSWTISDVNDVDVDGNTWLIRVYDSGSWLIPQGWSDDTGTFYCNLEAGNTGSISQFRFYVDQGDNYTLETVQAYGIANYTFAQHASTPTTDYYYVVNGTLIREASAAWYMELNYDPSINVTSTFRTVANISISHLVSSGGNNDFGFYQYVNGVGEWVYDETNFSLDQGFLTDFRIITYSDIWISNILFLQTPPHWNLVSSVVFYFDMPSWNEINTVQVVLTVAILQSDLSGWFMLIGAIMIPTSTIFLAVSRHSMSRDKLFFFLIMFIMGWGLLLGGILT